MALFVTVRVDSYFFRGSTASRSSAVRHVVFVTFRTGHILLMMALACFASVKLAALEVEVEGGVVAAHASARLVMVCVHLLESLFPHRFDFLLVVEAVSHLERNLLLLHG